MPIWYPDHLYICPCKITFVKKFLYPAWSRFSVLINWLYIFSWNKINFLRPFELHVFALWFHVSCFLIDCIEHSKFILCLILFTDIFRGDFRFYILVNIRNIQNIQNKIHASCVSLKYIFRINKWFTLIDL